ncbi:hypothetical protein NCGM2209_3633 [Mycobacterium tuberculosis NCGM2209]|nr:hypothetical protein NCGM2209_3633 [Mycobacterium tuberculosis NCGM2209]
MPHVGGQQARQVITDVAQARHQRRRPKRQRAGVVDPRQPRTEVEHAGVQCADVGNTRTRACQSGVRLVPPSRHVRAEVAETRAPARPGVEEARRRNGGGVPNARGGRDVDQRDVAGDDVEFAVGVRRDLRERDRRNGGAGGADEHIQVQQRVRRERQTTGEQGDRVDAARHLETQRDLVNIERRGVERLRCRIEDGMHRAGRAERRDSRDDIAADEQVTGVVDSADRVPRWADRTG